MPCQTHANLTRPHRTKPHRCLPIHTRPNRTCKLDRKDDCCQSPIRCSQLLTRPHLASPRPTQPNRAKPDPTSPNRATPCLTSPRLGILARYADEPSTPTDSGNRAQVASCCTQHGFLLGIRTGRALRFHPTHRKVGASHSRTECHFCSICRRVEHSVNLPPAPPYERD